MFKEVVAQQPDLSLDRPLIQPAHEGGRVVFDALGVAQEIRPNTPFSSADFAALNEMAKELLRIGRFVPFKGVSRYDVALIKVDPDAKYTTDLDEAFRAIAASRRVMQWFQEQAQISGLWVDTLQINLMRPGDFSVLHTHHQNRQALNAVMLLEGSSIGGSFSAATSIDTPLTSAKPYEIAKGDMVLFSPHSPHGVTPVIDGMRMSLVWGISSWRK